MAKPQIGLPVFLTRARQRGILACVIVGAASLVVMPRWPLLWIAQFSHYQHFIPLLILPGPLLLLALWRYRDRDAILLLVAACMPQRWFFDSFILWLIPKSRREIIWTVFFSWGAGLLSLASLSAQLRRGRQVGCSLSLPANAGGGSVAARRRPGCRQ